ncbi:protein RIC-3 [Rhinophrynus dorsalis]
MALSTIHKVILISCLVLCVSLLLPKAFLSRGKQAGPPDGNPGHFHSAMPQAKPTDGRPGGAHFPRSHLAEAMSKAKGGSGGTGGNRPSLVGQIIPIYGFGILLYILYILFKLSSRGKNTKIEPKSQPIRNGNLKRKITDYELSQLQDKLKETEEAMEKIISRLGPNCERAENMQEDEEQQLLERLKEITRVMKEGKVLDGVTPEQAAEEAPYNEDWEGYPEETYPIYDPSDCKRTHNTILVDCSVLSQPSAEEIAEQVEFGEEDNQLYTETLEVEENVYFNKEPNSSPRVTFVAQEDDLYSSEKAMNYSTWEDEEEDPAIIAENAGFTSDGVSEEEDSCSDELYMDSGDERESMGVTISSNGDKKGSLRKRYLKGSEF